MATSHPILPLPDHINPALPRIPLKQPGVGDVVASTEECSTALERSLQVEKKLTSDKLDAVLYNAPLTTIPHLTSTFAI